MKTKILTLALCLTGILAQNIQAKTTSEPISKEEATEFWTAFKKACEEKDMVKISQFLPDTIIDISEEQEVNAIETIIYTLSDYKETQLDYIMDIIGYEDDEILDLMFKISPDDPSEYVYSVNVHPKTIYLYFMKIGGRIKFYKIKTIYY